MRDAFDVPAVDDDPSGRSSDDAHAGGTRIADDARRRTGRARRIMRYAINQPLVFWSSFFSTVTAIALMWSIRWAIVLGIFGAIVTIVTSIIHATWRIASEADASAAAAAAVPAVARATGIDGEDRP